MLFIFIIYIHGGKFKIVNWNKNILVNYDLSLFSYWWTVSFNTVHKFDDTSISVFLSSFRWPEKVKR